MCLLVNSSKSTVFFLGIQLLLRGRALALPQFVIEKEIYMSHPTRTVNIFGGGIAGAALAHRLSKTCKVTLVDPLDFFEVPMSVPRSLVAPQFAEPAIFPFAVALPDVKHVSGRLTEWTRTGGKITLPDGSAEILSADVSVLATGTSFPNALMRSTGGSIKARKDFYNQFHSRLLTANRVLIVGGGPIGIEVAGEISEKFPQKNLTIIEAGPRILGATAEGMATHAQRVLEKRGVQLLLNERITSELKIDEVLTPAGECTTNSGRTIPYDLLIWCVGGGRPNTGYMRAQFAHCLDAAGRITVDAHLRVRGEPRLFALGDITNLDENKMAWHIDGQLKVAEANVRAALNGAATLPKAYRAKTHDPSMAVTLGSRQGVAHLPMFGLVTAGWLNRMAKAAHMLVPRYRKQFRL